MLLPLHISQVLRCWAISCPPVFDKKPVLMSTVGGTFQSPASIHGRPHPSRWFASLRSMTMSNPFFQYIPTSSTPLGKRQLQITAWMRPLCFAKCCWKTISLVMPMCFCAPTATPPEVCNLLLPVVAAGATDRLYPWLLAQSSALLQSSGPALRCSCILMNVC